MIDREIVFIVYVSDIEASVSFYTSILNLEVSFTSPRYVTMDLAPGVSLALWTGASNALHETSIRTSEVCINPHAVPSLGGTRGCHIGRAPS